MRIKRRPAWLAIRNTLVITVVLLATHHSRRITLMVAVLMFVISYLTELAVDWRVAYLLQKYLAKLESADATLDNVEDL